MLSKILLLTFLTCIPAFARARVWGFCEQGGQTVTVLGYLSSATTPIQRSYPTCTVTVFITGSGGMKPTIYSDNASTVLANPFTLGVSPETSTNGYWFFYVDNGTYDIQISGTGVPSPFTLNAVSILDPLAAGLGTVTTISGSGPAWLTWNIATPTTTPVITITPTTGQTPGQVIGTCGAATTFAPCVLTSTDIPAIYLLLTGGTLTGNLLFSVDNTHDIGASGATRPRDLFLGRNALIGGTLGVTGHTTFEGVTSTGATGTGALVYANSPVFTTPNIGTATGSASLNLLTANNLSDVVAATARTNLGLGTAAQVSSTCAGDLSGTLPNCTVTKINGTSFVGSTGDLVSFGAANTPADSGVVAANAVTSASGASAAKQTCVASGATKTCTYIDFPDVRVIPAAACNNATASIRGWDIPSGGTVTCRAGTNNLTGFAAITDTASTFAQFTTAIPEDWDTAVNPYIRFQIASTDTVAGHTIIPAIKVSCAKGDGSTTDDVTFNASHSLSTTTLNSTANQFWSTSNVQMNGTDMTGCIAGALMIVQVGRATDTATQAAFYSATVTFPRLLTVQAN